MAGMAIAAASAATASFTGLRGLAVAAGWPDRLAWLLPLTIDAYAMTSTRVWLAPGHARRGRGFAQANAIGAIGASIIGNAVYHMLSIGLLTVAWPIVVAVGAVPAAVLGLTAHLHALRTVDRDRLTTVVADEVPNGPDLGGASPVSGPPRRPDHGAVHREQDDPESGPQDGTEDRTVDTPKDTPRDGTWDEREDRTRSGPDAAPLPRSRARPRRRAKPRTEDELIQAARSADARYRAGHDGHPITRDALRAALRVAGPRATELRRRLAAESADTAPPEPAAPAQPSTATSDRKEAHSTT
jgi:hypothetical protein